VIKISFSVWKNIKHFQGASTCDRKPLHVGDFQRPLAACESEPPPTLAERQAEKNAGSA